jgi:hypothetical protein
MHFCLDSRSFFAAVGTIIPFLIIAQFPSAIAAPPAGKNWAMVWHDEFDGDTINTKVWNNLGDMSRQQGYWIKKYSYLDSVGHLVLRVDTAKGGYGAGGLSTEGKYEKKFGYFESRVKFPTQQGHWCAFWLMTMSQGTIGNQGTDGTEIDIMEKAWLTDHIQHALHWDGYGSNSGSAGQQVTNKGMNDGGWHVFGVDWSTSEYVFYVDGQETWRTNAGGVCQVADFIHLTDEIGNFGTGADVWGTGPISAAQLPDFYYVDYVRVYDTTSATAAKSGMQSPRNFLQARISIAQGGLIIKGIGPGVHNATLLSINGQALARTKVVGNKLEFAGAGIAPGTYIIRMAGNGNTVVNTQIIANGR